MLSFLAIDLFVVCNRGVFMRILVVIVVMYSRVASAVSITIIASMCLLVSALVVALHMYASVCS